MKATAEKHMFSWKIIFFFKKKVEFFNDKETSEANIINQFDQIYE